MMYRRLVLDYGHSAGPPLCLQPTPGKRYRINDGPMIHEGDLNRAIAARLLALLVGGPDGREVWDALRGRPVVPAPLAEGLCSTDIPLSARVATANRHPATGTLFLSLHCDAIGEDDHGPSLDARGASAYTSPGQTLADPAATVIWNALAATMPTIGGRIRKDGLRDGDPDYEAKYTVLTETHCPAVLVELGYFTNAADLSILRDPAKQDCIALALATSVRQLVAPAVGR